MQLKWLYSIPMWFYVITMPALSIYVPAWLSVDESFRTVGLYFIAMAKVPL